MTSPIETPDSFRSLSDEACIDIIKEKKAYFGDDLLILTHHYQRKELVPFHDYLGDSYALSAKAASKGAKYIAFCGVHFMAESADILTRPEQTVYLPNPYAGCPMADMAPRRQVFGAWDELGQVVDTSKVIPISYMNSSAVLKAFTGVNNGVVCTSSNADKAFDYAFARGEKIFFFPDQHLGRNTSNKKKFPRDQVVLWDPTQQNGGLSEDAIKKSKVILWQGHCHVHLNYTVSHIEARRKEFPDIQIVVHPECMEEVVDLADAVGSTKFIVNYVNSQPAGAKIAIGTELNLVARLIDEHPDKSIMALSTETCPMCVNMYRTTLNDLAYTLSVMEEGGGNIIRVEEPTRSEALLALERMLELE